VEAPGVEPSARRLGILEASRGFATKAAELAEGSALPAGSVSFRLTASKSMLSDNALTTDLLSLAHGSFVSAFDDSCGRPRGAPPVARSES